MIKTLNIILVMTSIAALVGVYMLKYTVEETASEKAAIERQIDRQAGGPVAAQGRLGLPQPARQCRADRDAPRRRVEPAALGAGSVRPLRHAADAHGGT